MKLLLLAVLDPAVSELLTLVAMAAGLGLFVLFGLAAKKWTFLKDRQALLAQGITWAYGAVEEYARKTETEIDDKAALALKKLGELLAANGHDPLTGGEQMKARMAFDTMHVVDKQQSPT